MELVALLFAVLAVVALALYVFVESETRGLIALLFAIALVAMALTVDQASRTASILVWSIGASAVPLLFSVHLYLRLSREERGARRIRPQGVVSMLAVIAFCVALVRAVPISPRASLDDANVATTLLKAFDVPVMLFGAALLATFVVGLLATRRQV
jgi:NADH:ubiquinone oxidoreductase subunit 6 (subunit J)